VCRCALTVVSSLREKVETDRYAPFVIATNDALEKLENLNINGLKRVPEGVERVIFLTNHPNEIQIQSREAASHRKPDVVIMQLNDAARAYPSSLRMRDWGQLKKVAPSGAKPRSFHRILSCIEFKATRSDLKMQDCLKNDIPLLDEMDPMHIIVDGPALRAAKRAAEKEGQIEGQASRASLSGSESRKRARESVDAGNDAESQPRSGKRVAVESGPSRSWYSRAAKGSPIAPAVAQPKQTTGSQPRNPQEKTSEAKSRDPILQSGSYAVEMLSMSRVHAWNILIIGSYLGFRPGSLF
jgi:hypothetical protein